MLKSITINQSKLIIIMNQNVEISIYEPHSRLKTGLVKTWIKMAHNVYTARELIWQLFRRDFLMSYKKSFIGMGWILISPIVGIVSWVFMNATGVLAPGEVSVPYPVYVLLGSTIWGLFMQSYGASKGTLSAGGGFITQVNYPHEALLVKQFLQTLAGFGINIILIVIVMILFGVIPPLQALLFPFSLIPLLFAGGALGLVVGLVSVVATDISKIVDRILGFAIYTVPVIYSTEVSNEFLRSVLQLNPLSYLIQIPRNLMIGDPINDQVNAFLIVGVFTLIIFLISLRLFYVSEEQVIEKMI